jgi:hypothetical protein
LFHILDIIPVKSPFWIYAYVIIDSTKVQRFWVQGSEVLGSGFRGSGFWVLGSGFRGSKVQRFWVQRFKGYLSFVDLACRIAST